MVFMGLFDLKKPGEYPYLMIGEHPEEGGDYGLRRGRLAYGELGREISFQELPIGCQKLVRKKFTGSCGV